MQRIFLIGYMGVGKTTLGSPLAKALGFSFIDLDHFIENRYHKTVQEIFKQYGEAYFRRVEQKILKEVCTFEKVVIATGGGAPCFYDNMEEMNRSGLTILLEVSLPELYERLKLGKNKRPILRDKNEAELLEFIKASIQERAVFYNQSRLRFNVDDLYSVEAINKVVREIVDAINIL